MRFRTGVACCSSLGAIVIASACGPQPPAPTRQKPPRNVLLVLVDTLRADHLSAYGYSRATSPQLDLWARGATLFERAYSQASCTFPSVNSLFTSRPAPLFWGQPEGRMGIPAGVPTLAEALSARGLTTIAVSASPVVRKTPTRFNPAGGFDRGFDVFDESCLWRDAACVAERAAGLLASPRGPFFAYLHFMDPHGPYQPPAGHRRRFAGAYSGKDFIAAGDPNPIARMLYDNGPRIDIEDRDREHLVDLYDDEIAWWDEQFAALLQRLAGAGALADTLVIVTADHGEAFLEHGGVKHCHTLFDEEIHTPLLVRWPGQTAGARIAAPAGNIDLAPTILDALGFTPEPAFAGHSHARWLEGSQRATGGPPAAGTDSAYSAQGALRGVTDGRYKLVLDLATDAAVLYDLADDPGETRDASRDRPAAFRDLRRRLLDHLAATEGPRERSVAAGQEAEARLRALGYLQ